MRIAAAFAVSLGLDVLGASHRPGRLPWVHLVAVETDYGLLVVEVAL